MGTLGHHLTIVSVPWYLCVCACGEVLVIASLGGDSHCHSQCSSVWSFCVKSYAFKAIITHIPPKQDLDAGFTGFWLRVCVCVCRGGPSTYSLMVFTCYRTLHLRPCGLNSLRLCTLGYVCVCRYTGSEGPTPTFQWIMWARSQSTPYSPIERVSATHCRL